MSGESVRIEEWTACRLKSLVQDGYAVLEQQGRGQRGFDGYTLEDLAELEEILKIFSKEFPEQGGNGNIVLRLGDDVLRPYWIYKQGQEKNTWLLVYTIRAKSKREAFKLYRQESFYNKAGEERYKVFNEREYKKL